MATRTSTASPGVITSPPPKWIWNADTPNVVPAGARISAGKSGKVEKSLPASAVSSVNWLPVTCIPSPESPAKRMTTESRVSRPARRDSVDVTIRRNLHDVLQHEPHVGGPLGEAAHVPGEPRAAVADQDLHRGARGRETALLVRPDTVQHVEFIRRPVEPLGRRGLLDPGHQLEIVGPENRLRAVARRFVEQTLRELVVVRVYVFLARICDRRRLVVRAFLEP